MTNEDIIRLAREALVPDASCAPAGELMPWVKRFAELVAAHERDACAQIADSWAKYSQVGGEIANVIKARGNA